MIIFLAFYYSYPTLKGGEFVLFIFPTFQGGVLGYWEFVLYISPPFKLGYVMISG